MVAVKLPHGPHIHSVVPDPPTESLVVFRTRLRNDSARCKQMAYPNPHSSFKVFLGRAHNPLTAVTAVKKKKKPNSSLERGQGRGEKSPLLTKVALRGHWRNAALRWLGEASERASCWLGHKREDTSVALTWSSDLVAAAGPVNCRVSWLRMEAETKGWMNVMRLHH